MTSIKANFVLAAAGLALATLASTAGLARSVESGATQRPANVPANYLLTPYGYVAPQAIVRLRKGESVAMRQAQRRVARDAVPGECQTLPRFSASGERLDAPGRRRGVLAYTEHYFARAAVDFPKDYQAVQASTDVIVPPEPTRTSNQVIYLTTGLHDSEEPLGPIIMTTVGWNTLDEKLKWDAVTWFYSPNDRCMYTSEPVNLTPGQKVRQTIEARQANGQHEIQASILDLETNAPLVQTTFKPSSFEPDQIVNVGLDAANVRSCDRLPAGGEITFPSISASLTTSAGEKDISDQITIRPADEHKCDIVLTLSE